MRLELIPSINTKNPVLNCSSITSCLIQMCPSTQTLCLSGETAAAPCETPLIEKNSLKPALEQPSLPSNPQPQTPPAESQKVAFKLGGSEEADLNTDIEPKDLDISNGEKLRA